MKVPYDEGLASHIGPESCVYARKGIAASLWRDAAGPCVVREPVHVYKFFDREPGGPTFGHW